VLPCGFSGCGSFNCIISYGGGVAGSMGGCGGMAGRASSKPSGSFISFAGGGVGGYRGDARISALDFASCPCSSSLNCFPWPIVVGVFLFEG